MIRLTWQGQQLDVRRLVFRRGFEASFDAALDTLADRHHLATADDAAEARPGDFWLGCHPRTGWGDADPARIGWACQVEVPLAVGLLRRGLLSEDPRRVVGRIDERLVEPLVVVATA